MALYRGEVGRRGSEEGRGGPAWGLSDWQMRGLGARLRCSMWDSAFRDSRLGMNWNSRALVRYTGLCLGDVGYGEYDVGDSGEWDRGGWEGAGG